MPYEFIGKDGRIIKAPTEYERNVAYNKAAEIERYRQLSRDSTKPKKLKRWQKELEHDTNLVQDAMNQQVESSKKASAIVAANAEHNAEKNRLKSVEKTNFLKTGLNILSLGTGVAALKTPMTSMLYRPLTNVNAVLSGTSTLTDVVDGNYLEAVFDGAGLFAPLARFTSKKPIPTATLGSMGHGTNKRYIIDFSKHLECIGVNGDIISLIKQIIQNNETKDKLDKMAMGGIKQSFTPNVVAGGKAIPLKPNLFYMKGRKHSQGGIDVGKSLEVEDGEVMQLTPKTIRVFSAEKFLGGRSPAEKVLAGENIDKTFKEQEDYKDRNSLNDDGTKKKAQYGLKIGPSYNKKTKTWVNSKNQVLSYAKSMFDELPDDYKYYIHNAKKAKQRNVTYDKKKFGGIANIKNNTINTIRERLYNNVSPYGYHQPIKRLTQGVLLNKDAKDNDRFDRDDIWAEYLQIPKNKRRKVNSTKVVDSKYKPTKGNSNVKYKALTLTDDDKNSLIYHGNKEYKINVGSTNRSGALGHYLGNHSISRGIDKNKGEYISYYDKWDIAPFKDKEDESLGIGKPIEFYDRLYLDDYYNVDKSNHEENAKTGYYGGYLQEITVNAKAKTKNKDKKAMGGITSIHTFTGGRKQSRIIARAGTNKDRELYDAVMRNNPGALPRKTFINENGDLVDDKGNIIQRNNKSKTNSYNYNSLELRLRKYLKENDSPFKLSWPSNAHREKVQELNIAYPKDYEETKKNKEELKDEYIGDIEQKPIELNIAYPRENNKPVEQKVTPAEQKVTLTTTTKPATVPAKVTTVPAKNSTTKTTTKSASSTKTTTKSASSTKTTTKSASSTKTTTLKTKSTKAKSSTKPVTLPKSTTPISSIPKLNPNVATREQAKSVNIHNYTIPQGIARTGRTAPKTNPGKPNISKTRLIYDPTKDTNESTFNNKLNNKIINYIKNSKVVDYIKNNPADFISAGSNMIGSLSSFLVNRSMINNMKAPSAPVTKIAAKLNTYYNINPQLDEIRETTGANINTIRENTSSSATSINRINKVRNFGNSQVNKLYGEKENIQTQLINQDKLNQQEVANANIDAYNNYKDRLTDFYNRNSDLTSENRQALITGLNSSVQDVISKKEQRDQDILSLALIHGSHPNTRKYIEAHYPTLYKKLKPFYQ